ncbi:Gp138 family membrane-puncturing spike protein [Paenibacillus glucanolyticus]|uniref:Gp138 family membrane-puncturing spike protein n=1 Tax=Paenibacillus glucanolyticus TaxID=59843 RepID=UPI0035D7FD19
MKGLLALNALIEEKLLNLHTGMPCKVISFDDSSMRAIVQPLFMTKEMGASPEALPLIQDVPVLKHRFKVDGGQPQVYEPVYEAGDIVFVAFAQRALDDALGGQMVYPDFNRRHDLNDAVILGVIA